MLKIRKPSNTFNEKEYDKNQEDIKNSIKKLYIGNQNKKKTIDEYAQLTTQIREEYAKLQAKCVQLENTIQKYKDYVERMEAPRSRIRRRPAIKRNRVPYRYDNRYDDFYDERHKNPQENEYLNENEIYEDEDEYFNREGIAKPKRKKRIVYIDEVDAEENDGGDDQEEVEETEEPQAKNKITKKVVLPKKKLKKEIKKVGIVQST